MSAFTDLIDDLVAANRILAAEDVVDAYGHVSVRNPNDPTRYFMARARAPEVVEADDIMEFTLDGTPIDAKGRRPYLERFIHGAMFEARPDVQSVVHNHSEKVIPFGATGIPLKPIMHNCSPIGHEVPIWDAQTRFGDTNMLVTDMAMGRDLAQTLGNGATALMRGHGCVVSGRSIREAVFTAVYLQLNAELQMQALQLGKPVKFLTKGEVDIRASESTGRGDDRAWERWCRRAGVPFKPQA